MVIKGFATTVILIISCFRQLHSYPASSWFRLSQTTGSPSSKYVVYATACVYRELYGKITDRKKNCVNNSHLKQSFPLVKLSGNRGRKTLFQMRCYLHNFFYDRLFSHTILYIRKLSHTPRILSLGSLCPCACPCLS